MPPEVLAAILIGPVANAFVAEHSDKRDIQKGVMMQIPVPRPDRLDFQLITSLVREFHENLFDQPNLLLQIDAEIIRAYDLHPRFEKKLLASFAGEARPGANWFTGYYPENFNAALPLHEIVGGGLDRAHAGMVLKRLNIMRSEDVSTMLSDVEEHFSGKSS
jgi:hypothetical protein